MSQDNTWKNQWGYVWALIGSAVGFANILSFSAQVYKNGGGAFLLPYGLALFLLGIPLLLLEGIVGHHWKSPLVTAYGIAWGKIGKVFGWLAVIACLSIGGFYVVLTGYSVAYTYFSMTSQIPVDSKAFFLDSFLQATPSITEFGKISFPIFFATLFVVGATWMVLVRNIRSGIERICSIFMPLLVIILLLFAIAVCFLPGGMDGWSYYLKPNFSKLLEPTLWRDIFGQLFFSLSLGLGIIVGYSRHTGKKANIRKAMFYVALGDFLVSFIAGFAIFGCLAHISYTQNIPFDSILTTESTFEIGFILFPKILQFFGSTLSSILGMIFFFCIFIAGITGVFSIVESIVGNVEVEFQTSRKRAVTLTLAALLVLSLLFCMGNSSHILDALVPMVLGTNMLLGGLALLLAFRPAKRGVLAPLFWSSGKKYDFYVLCLQYIAPVILAIILVGNVTQEFSSWGIGKSVRWSWFVLALVCASFLARHAKTESHVCASSATC